MTSQEITNLFIGMGGGGVLLAIAQRFLSRGDRADLHEKEQYQRLLEECKRKADELIVREGELEKRDALIEELREVFNKLQTAHIPQTTENALMRIARRNAVIKLEKLHSLIEENELLLALRLTLELIEELSQDIILPRE